MSKETERIAQLTGISDERLKQSELPTYGDIAATSEEEIVALAQCNLSTKQRRKVKAIRNYLLNSNTIDDDTTMEGILAFAHHAERQVSSNRVDKNANALVDLDNGIVVAEADPIAVPSSVYEHHYAARGETVEEPHDSKDYLDLTETETVSLPPGCVGSFSESDQLWPAHAIEKRKAFTLFAEKAHIFPHRECVKTHSKGGKKTKRVTGYEWLDDPMEAEFNFLCLSPIMHLAYKGSVVAVGRREPPNHRFVSNLWRALMLR